MYTYGIERCLDVAMEPETVRIREGARRADIAKAVTSTNFRKSTTRWLVQLGFEQPRTEGLQRAPGSDPPVRYIAGVSGRRAYAPAHSLEGDLVTADHRRRERDLGAVQQASTPVKLVPVLLQSGLNSQL